MSANKSKKLSATVKVLLAIGLIIIVVLGITGIKYYVRYFSPNVTGNTRYLYISTGSKFNNVMDSLRKSNALKDTNTFKTAAISMNYPANVKPGKYRLKSGMSNRRLINMLKSGAQEPVELRFQNLRLKKNFAGYVSRQIEADSLNLISLLDSSSFVKNYGFTTQNVYTMFIPNSYELYWNTSAEEFFRRMHKEYQKFWTPGRKQKAQQAGLDPVEVSILASIVDAEALHDNEMPKIAGLYLNRLHRGIRLQADPTVIFANNDFSIRRVLNKQLQVNSPYNTYKFAGLPPGPIMMPSVNAIDAVLNYQKHNYLYMCAKEDFSGYHNFAVTEAEHKKNARRFQEALNRLKIMK